jgi:adenylate cyclase
MNVRSTPSAFGKRIAKLTLERCEKVIAQDRNNLVAVSWLSTALAVLGEGDRAREWMKRALLIDPNSVNTRYNFACTLGRDLKDVVGAIELLGPAFECMAIGLLNHAKIDPDLDVLRDDPRFKAMIAAAEKRLAATSGSPDA